jgi:hypothetical protein
MKSIFTLFLFLFFGNIYSQSIKENKIDEFTKIKTIATDWEVLNREFSCGCASFHRFKRINNTNYFEFKYMDSKVLSVMKGDVFMFKLNNDSIVSLKSAESIVGCRGCGAIGLSGSEAYGIKVSYYISEEDFEKLKNNTITKIRFYTTSGYINLDVKEKKALIFVEALKLFLNTK